MKGKRMRTGVIFALSLALVAGFASSAGAAGGRIIKVDEKDSGSVVEVAAGGKLRVVLTGNPTTGYNWEVSSLDRSVLRLESQSFKRDRKLIGSGGRETLTFEALAPGQTILQIVYHRSFETNVPPAKTFELTVIVSPAR